MIVRLAKYATWDEVVVLLLHPQFQSGHAAADARDRGNLLSLTLEVKREVRNRRRRPADHHRRRRTVAIASASSSRPTRRFDGGDTMYAAFERLICNKAKASAGSTRARRATWTSGANAVPAGQPRQKSSRGGGSWPTRSVVPGKTWPPRVSASLTERSKR